MTTIVEQFDGVGLIRPADPFFEWPHPTFVGFPSCCGPGKNGGLLEKAVPETILGLEVSPICWVHDWMQLYGPRSWQGFHHSNAVFLTNLLEANRMRSGQRSGRRQDRRILHILAWYEVVASPIGAANFFKKNQSKEVDNADV